MWTDRRWLPIAAAVSLLLNVFLVGLVVGHFLLAERPHGGGGGGGRGALVKAGRMKTLSPEERHAFTAAMASHRPAIRAARQAFRAQRAATEADLVAPQFDRDKVASDLAALRAANARVIEEVHAALVDAMGPLPQHARDVLVSNQREGPPGNR